MLWLNLYTKTADFIENNNTGEIYEVQDVINKGHSSLNDSIPDFEDDDDYDEERVSSRISFGTTLASRIADQFIYLADDTFEEDEDPNETLREHF